MIKFIGLKDSDAGARLVSIGEHLYTLDYYVNSPNPGIRSPFYLAAGCIVWYRVDSLFAVFSLTTPWDPASESEESFIERLEHAIQDYISSE